jgi:NAD(P)H-hydrate epimerase
MTPLPAWLEPLPDAEQMRAVDRWAIEEQGVPGLELMERAGSAVASAVERVSPDGPVTVVCGKGNNGGDGLVVARLLRHAGREVTVVSIAPPGELAGDARENLERLQGPGPVRLDGSPWEDGGASSSTPLPERGAGPTVVVDAVLGTGFAGAPRGEAARAIEAINACPAPVVSVDVPSGVDASSGEIAGGAVGAASTVTFHAGKPGLWIMPGKACAGEVETVPIGIPRGAPTAAEVGLISREVVSLLPRRGSSWTKFKSGQVLVVGGSRGLSGAPAMAARASMRAGAGYVTTCVPRGLQRVLAGSGTPEMMTRGLDEDDAGGLAPEAVEPVVELAARGGTVALGPGLGRSAPSLEFARALARALPGPLVLDADALNAHAGRLSELAGREQAAVLTPHSGELGRLLELDSEEIDRARLEHVRDAARDCGSIVVLKGDDSLVAQPDGRVAVSPGGTPALATAGTGDVLTGVIAALIAQGLDPFAGACAGVWLHAEAGRRAARELGIVEGVIASDVIEALPGARAAAAQERSAQSGAHREGGYG